MKNIKNTFIAALLASTLFLMPGCQNAEQTSDSTETDLVISPGYTALIVTGQNNHKWEVSSPVLKEILENSGVFTAEIIESPAKGEDMSGFKPDFAAYDLVVMDYTGDAWPDETKAAFEEYVLVSGGEHGVRGGGSWCGDPPVQRLQKRRPSRSAQ